MFEYADLGGQRTSEVVSQMGTELLRMHRSGSKTGLFGFDIKNTLGETFQLNPRTASWTDFFVESRLKHIPSYFGAMALFSLKRPPWLP